MRVFEMIELINEKWPEILEFLKSGFEIAEVSYNTFLAPLKPYRYADGKIYIIASSSPAIVSIVSKKYRDYVFVAIKSITEKEIEPVFISEEEKDHIPEHRQTVVSGDPYTEAVKKAKLNPQYTFESFVSGKSNELAHAAALAVAESPGEEYRILYIYGGVGLGKTHLMQAIAHYILKKKPSTNILYVSSETFTNDYIESLKKKDDPALFREKYRKNPDVLLIDDIQFIAGRVGTQEEFFHTFNELYDNNKQIVITSDKPPRDINNLEERIRTRFEQGLLVDIQVPDFETRMAILRKKEEEANISIDDEVIRFIAENIKSNIRTLEGALRKLILRSRLAGVPIDVEMARENLKDMIGEGGDTEEITPQRIISIVCEHFSITEKDFLSIKKNKEVAFPRQVAMYLCCEMTDASLQYLGEIMGGRDHSTIIHGRDKIAAQMKAEPQLKSTIETLKKKIEL